MYPFVWGHGERLEALIAEAERVVARVEAVAARCKAIDALRQRDGRRLGKERRAQVRQMADMLVELMAAFDALED